MKKTTSLIALILTICLVTVFTACDYFIPQDNVVDDENNESNVQNPDTNPSDKDDETSEDECEHEWNIVEEIKHTQEDNGKYIYTCKICSKTESVYDTIHTWSEVSVEATCTTGKFVYTYCSVCEKQENGEYVSEPNGHKFIEDYLIVEEGKTMCDDGGKIVSHCTVCLEKSYVTVEATGHTVAADGWDYDNVVDPGVSYPGFLIGRCVNCSKSDVVYELPALLNEHFESNEAYILTTLAATCYEKGEIIYNYVDTDANVDYSFEITIPATNPDR